MMKIEKTWSAYTLTIEASLGRPAVDSPDILMFPQARRAIFIAWPILTCPDLAPKEGKHNTTVLEPL